MRFLTITLTAVSALALAGCASKAPKELPPQASTVPSTSTPAPTGPTGPVAGSSADFMAQMQGRNVIFFDTDKFDVDDDDVAALRAQAEWLQRYPSKTATIEGHADERGTRDYNLALGERRANAAKNYLVGLGINAARLSTVSYGKERPVALGSDEASWAQNRRAATIVID
jgi:peptidoglycan-associated lipoprotein